MPRTKRILRKTLTLAVCTLGLVALVDFVIFGEQDPGAPAGAWQFSQGLPWFLVAGILQALLFMRKPKAQQSWRNVLLAAGTALLTISFLIEPTTLAAWLIFPMLMAFSLSRESRGDQAVGRLLRTTLSHLLLCWGFLVSDLFLLRRWRASRLKKRWRFGSFVSRWIFPSAGAALFLVLFSSSNPIFKSLFTELFEALARIELPETSRVFVWGVTAAAVWALLRAKARHLPSRPPANPRARGGADGVCRSLTLFNLVFALNNFFDFEYLWAGRSLPPGLSFADYAHRGAYSLFCTTILAALFIIVGFSQGKPACEDVKARRLVYLWAAQNIFLLFSTLLRLVRYVQAYAMSELRLYVMIWCAVVLLGFVLLVIRIAENKPNEWLIRLNSASALIVLVASCLINFNGFIAWYNVLRSGGTDGPRFDSDYVFTLGPEALPALQWYQDKTGSTLYWVPARLHIPGARCGQGCAPSFSLEFNRVRLMQETTHWRYDTLRRKFIRSGISAPPQGPLGWLRVLLLN